MQEDGIEEGQASKVVEQMPKWRYIVWIALFVILVVSVSVFGPQRQNLLASFGNYYFWLALAFLICFGFLVNRVRFKRWI